MGLWDGTRQGSAWVPSPGLQTARQGLRPEVELSLREARWHFWINFSLFLVVRLCICFAWIIFREFVNIQMQSLAYVWLPQFLVLQQCFLLNNCKNISKKRGITCLPLKLNDDWLLWTKPFFYSLGCQWRPLLVHPWISC